ncbi:thrombospondin type-1 domain-containing protein 4 [Leptopilina heterotoma]|uniref:thrombospondin type-1 domain-containing protein 4 n=1 Tax=Leptopilina heterotoma TaxID=63436 RepID=UPI001CA88769|nr:thrombospondin type-1 domain-containing protein 4 [Leptopilina heterotoma]
MDFLKSLGNKKLSSFIFMETKRCSRKRRRGRNPFYVRQLYCWLLMMIMSRKFPTVYCTRGNDVYLNSNDVSQKSFSGFVRNNRIGGNWGSWGPWSECSRPCGTGVQSQVRECVPFVGKQLRKRYIMGHNDTISARPSCVGIYKRYHICNTQNCPNFYPDVRTHRCSKYNGKLYKGRIFAWEPFLDAPNSCALNCRAIGERFYATFEHSVPDGTHCRPNFLLPTFPIFKAKNTDQWLCVAGHCKSVGCDGIIDSGLVINSCGICGVDDKDCEWFEGSFVEPTLSKGYHFVVQIPKGAMSINISELRASENLIALKDENGEYITNGPWSLSPSGIYNVAGSPLIYERGNENQVEYIQTTGPLNESLRVELWIHHQNPGIVYKYTLSKTIPENIVITSPPPIDLPGSLSLNEIPHPTVEGIFETTTERIRSSPLIIPTQQDNEIDKKTKQLNVIGTSIPPTTSMAGDQPNSKVKRRRRKFIWKISNFSSCSKPCGGGFQRAIFRCFRRITDEIVDERKCRNITKPVGPSARCNDRPCAARWRAESWTECSVTCGSGVRTRKVECVQKLNSRLTVRVAAGTCIQPPDLGTWEVCKLPPCQIDEPEIRHMDPVHPRWEVGLWSPCSVTCGQGTRIRNVTCITSNEPCLSSNKPQFEEFCEAPSCPTFPELKAFWLFSEWSSKCSTDCGSGVETRRIICSHENKTLCNSTLKPLEERQCFGNTCSKTLWFTGPWTACSATCGVGIRKRDVVCASKIRDELTLSSDSACDFEKPLQEEICTMSPCSAEWFTSDWTECTVTCGSGVRTRAVRCISNENDINDCIESEKPRDKHLCIGEFCRKSEFSTENPIKSGNAVGNCTDEYPYCELVLKADLCRIKYYNHSCCGCHS